MATKKKLSNQVKDLSIKELRTAFRNKPEVLGLLKDLLVAIDKPDDAVNKLPVVGHVDVRKLKDKTVYRTRVWVGKRNGKDIYRSVTADTYDESQRLAIDLQVNKDLGKPIPVSKKQTTPTLSEWIASYISTKSLSVEPTTIDFYNKKTRPYIINPTGLNKDLPRIGNIKLNNLEAKHFEELFKAMLDRNLTGITINHLKSILSGAFNMAIAKGLLNVSPLERVDSIAIEQAEAQYLTEEELAKVVVACEDNSIGALVMLCIYTGVRKSEARGLTWEDIDFDRGQIFIKLSAKYVIGRGVEIRKTKTRGSRRLIELTPENLAFPMLKKLKEIRQLELMVAGESVKETDLVFCYANGQPWGDTKIRKNYLKIWKATGITKPKCGIHTLRHTYATLSLAQGEDVKQISRTLGHKNVAITYDRYSHAIKGSGRKASERFDNMLKDAKDKVE